MYEYFKNLCWKSYHDLLSKECAYGYVIHNRTITQSTLGRGRNGAMTKTRWNDSAMPMMQVHDYYGAMVWWRRSDIILHHCYCIISASSIHQAMEFFAHMRYLKKMATGLHCNLQLLWFIYHWSNIMHACMKWVYRTCFYLMLIR